MSPELSRALAQGLDWYIAQIMQESHCAPQVARITRLEGARDQFAHAGLNRTCFADLPAWMREVLLQSGAWPPSEH